MDSSDIYDMKEPPQAKRAEPPKNRGRRRHSEKTFDEAVNPDLANTHRRRSRNSGFRRLRHRLKDPHFSRKFWTITLGAAGLILIILIIWDLFLRYPAKEADYTPLPYRVEAE